MNYILFEAFEKLRMLDLATTQRLAAIRDRDLLNVIDNIGLPIVFYATTSQALFGFDL